MGKTQTLFNPSQVVFLCNERDKLVSELKHILHANIFGGNPIFEGKCNFANELESDLKQRSEATVRLYPTAVQVVSKAPMAPDLQSKQSFKQSL